MGETGRVGKGERDRGKDRMVKGREWKRIEKGGREVGRYMKSRKKREETGREREGKDRKMRKR